MDGVCPSLPLKILTPNLTDAELSWTRKHKPYIAADGCPLATCSLCVRFVIIEFFLMLRNSVIARAVLYKARLFTVSRTFSRITFSENISEIKTQGAIPYRFVRLAEESFSHRKTRKIGPSGCGNYFSPRAFLRSWMNRWVTSRATILGSRSSL